MHPLTILTNDISMERVWSSKSGVVKFLETCTVDIHGGSL